jgi:hypothetical protein
MFAHNSLISLQWHKQLQKACTSEGMDDGKYNRHRPHLEYMLLPDCYTDLFRSEAGAGRGSEGEEMFSTRDEQLFQASTLKKLREIQTPQLKLERLFPVFLKIELFLRSCLQCIFSECYVVMLSEIKLLGF